MIRRLIRCLCWAALLAGCSGPRSERASPPLAQQIDRSLSSATRYLIEHQSADGAWRSDVYGAFKEGDALTPLVLQALLRASPSQDRDAACRKGAAYLAAMARSDGTIDAGSFGLTYPVHTAAAAVEVLSWPGNQKYTRARDIWLVYLCRQQLTEELGWQPADLPYGGWGYAKNLPRKPPSGTPVPPIIESNLSATVCALEALRAAGCSGNDPAFRKARVFVERCQNFSDGPGRGDPAFDDGGFFFIRNDAGRNKAGVAGTDQAGQKRYFSYGSTTADGLRALLALGLPPEHARVQAARHWLEEHFRADAHPGRYAGDREAARPSLYYYYCASTARALRAAGVHEVSTGAAKKRWAALLAAALLERQREDGSWANLAVEVREDDPLVATSLAVITLAVCRDGMPDY